MAEEIKRVKRELAYKGAILEVYKDTMEYGGGEQTIWDYIHHNGAAAVVPVLKDGRILMVKQFRNALDRDTLEIPAGKKDSPEEKGIDCAIRELEEETGYASNNMEWLINICAYVAFCNEKIEVFVAKDLVPTSQNLDEDEFIDVYAFTIDELKEKIFSGEIEDGKTISALMAYDAKYNR